jgi:RNA polymerase sigma factor (sigma-70 family)
MTSHRQLLADYAETGSEEAFRELVTAYIGFVHGSALRLVEGNVQLAEDVTQTVFTDLARRAKILSPDVMVGGWLHRRACHAAATVMRGERRRRIREQEAAHMHTLNHDTPDLALAAIAPVLDESINQLGSADRAAITLRFFEQLNNRAIGESLGITEAAAQKRVERALEKLRRLLARRGLGLTTVALALAVSTASATAAPTGLATTAATAALAAAPAGTGFTLTTLKFMTIAKIKLTAVAVMVALLAAGTATTIILHHREAAYGYTPPANPDPQAILNEAQADTAAGRYREALAKHIWYRDNALRYQPSQVGVRNSFALSYWAELAGKYPPAREKLEAIRDQALAQVQDPSADVKTVLSAFITVVSIDNGLQATGKNVELFKWLDTHNPAAARRAYPVAERDLIEAREYTVCGRYLDADASYRRILNMYNVTKRARPASPELEQFAVKSFSNQSARLVAVLALNHQTEAAARVSGEAAKTIGTPEFATLLAEARTGKVPPVWP